MPRYPYRQIGVELNRDFRNDQNKNLVDIAADIGDQSEKLIQVESDSKSRDDATNKRVDNIVINASGDSNAEVVDARVEQDGTTHTVLKNRLDSEQQKVNSRLTDIITLDVKHLPAPLVSAVADYDPSTGSGTDNTAAIQSALDYLAAHGGGTLLFPAGMYLVSGALQDPDNYNAVIKLPQIDSHNDRHVTIQIQGSFIPVTAYSVSMSQPVYENASIIFCKTADDDTSAKASVIGSDKANRNGLTFIARNMIFRQPNNPTLKNLQLRKVANVILENIVNDVDADITSGVAVPTHENAIAVELPTNNNFGVVEVDNYYAVGYYSAAKICEHARIGKMFAQCCYNGFTFIKGGHLTTAAQLLTQWCKRNIAFDENDDDDTVTDTSCYVDIQGLDTEYFTESTNATWALEFCIYDPNSHFRGTIHKLHEVLPGSGEVPTAVTGCHGLYINRVPINTDLESLATSGIIDKLTLVANTIYYFLGSKVNKLIINEIDASNLNTGDRVYFVSKSDQSGSAIYIYGNQSGKNSAFFPDSPYIIGVDYQSNDVIIPFICTSENNPAIRHIRPAIWNINRNMQEMPISAEINPYMNQLFRYVDSMTFTITSINVSLSLIHISEPTRP